MIKKIILFTCFFLQILISQAQNTPITRLYYLVGWSSSNYRNLNNQLQTRSFSPVNSRFQPFMGIGWDFEYRKAGVFFDIKLQPPVRSGETRNWHTNFALGAFYNFVQKKNIEVSLWGNIGYTEQYMTTVRNNAPSTFQDLLDVGNAITLNIAGTTYETGFQIGFKKADVREYVKFRIGYRFSPAYAWKEGFFNSLPNAPKDQLNYFTISLIGYPLNNRIEIGAKKRKNKTPKQNEETIF